MDGMYARAGWNGEALVNASPGLLARVAAADAEDRKAAARADAERRYLGEMRQEADIALSVRMAEERGEVISPRQRMEGVGRTRAEAIEYYTAVQDLEDARRHAAWRKRMAEAGFADSAALSGDLTVPTEEEMAESKRQERLGAQYRAKHPHSNGASVWAAKQAEEQAEWERKTPEQRRAWYRQAGVL